MDHEINPITDRTKSHLDLTPTPNDVFIISAEFLMSEFSHAMVHNRCGKVIRPPVAKTLFNYIQNAIEHKVECDD